jgi:hypothetical protein
MCQPISRKSANPPESACRENGFIPYDITRPFLPVLGAWSYMTRHDALTTQSASKPFTEP